MKSNGGKPDYFCQKVENFQQILYEYDWYEWGWKVEKQALRPFVVSQSPFGMSPLNQIPSTPRAGGTCPLKSLTV